MREANRDRLLRRFGNALAAENVPLIGTLGSGSGGSWDVYVNGREHPRTDVSANEFGAKANAMSEGDPVVMISSDYNDMPTIIGISPWVV